MKIRFINKAAAVFISAVMLTACAQVPQNVKDRNEELESIREAESSQAAEAASGAETAQTDDKRVHTP